MTVLSTLSSLWPFCLPSVAKLEAKALETARRELHAAEMHLELSLHLVALYRARVARLEGRRVGQTTPFPEIQQ